MSSPSPSRSIPINQGRQSRIARAEEAEHRDAMMADYVDFCFASRLVSGMQKRQSFTHDVSLRYENQALIDHIIATRQGRDMETVFFPTGDRRNGVRAPPRSNSNEKLNGSNHHVEDETQREEDDMIFDMEL